MYKNRDKFSSIPDKLFTTQSNKTLPSNTTCNLQAAGQNLGHLRLKLSRDSRFANWNDLKRQTVVASGYRLLLTWKVFRFRHPEERVVNATSEVSETFLHAALQIQTPKTVWPRDSTHYTHWSPSFNTSDPFEKNLSRSREGIVEFQIDRRSEATSSHWRGKPCSHTRAVSGDRGSSKSRSTTRMAQQPSCSTSANASRKRRSSPLLLQNWYTSSQSAPIRSARTTSPTAPRISRPQMHSEV